MKLYGLLAIALLVVAFGVQDLSAQTPTWIPLSSLFGAAKPFRQGHTAAMTTFGRMVSFSGLDNTLTGSQQVSRYNYLSNSQLQILPDVPQNNRPSRQRCAWGTWADNVLVVYGGLVGGQNSNEFLAFDITAGTWDVTNDTSLSNSQFNIENHFTFPSNGVAGAIDQGNNFFYLFGGTSTALQLNFVSYINLSTHVFFQVNATTQTAPDRRFGSAMSFVSNTLWVFGGMSALGTAPNLQDVQIFNDMWTFSVGSASPVWAQVGTSGTAPSARAFAANCLRVDGTSWIIFGGENDDPAVNTWYADVFSFDLSGTNFWTPISPATPNGAPTPRSKLVAVLLGWSGEDSILFHGGTDSTGGTLNEFWKLQIVTNGTSPIQAPTNLDVDADNTDVNQGTTQPPPSSSIVSSSHAVTGILPPGSAASSLSSWLQWN